MQFYFRFLQILFFILISLPVQALAADSIPWRPNIESALDEAQRDNKLVLLHFWGYHCPPCRRLEKNVFSRKDVAQAIAAQFVAVKINVTDSPALQRQYQVNSWPTDIILDTNKKEVYRDISEQSPLKFIAVLEQIAAKQKNHRNLSAATTNRTATRTLSTPAEITVDANRQSSFRITGISSPEALTEHSQPFHPSTSLGTPTVPTLEATSRASNPNPQFPLTTGTTTDASQTEIILGKAPSTIAPTSNTEPTSNQPPPLGLDGFCPVTLAGWAGKFPQWQPGNPKWGAIHRGQLYLFVGQDEQQAFLQTPDRFSPMLAGRDVVRMIKYGEKATGERRHGVTYRDHVYLFRDEYSLQEFRKAPAFFSREALKRMPIQR